MLRTQVNVLNPKFLKNFCPNFENLVLKSCSDADAALPAVGAAVLAVLTLAASHAAVTAAVPAAVPSAVRVPSAANLEAVAETSMPASPSGILPPATAT